MAHHNLVVHPLVLRRVQVERVLDVTRRMRRITLTGEQLGTFTHDEFGLPAFASPAFDDHVKLIFASDGDVRSVLPRQLEDGIDWSPSETRQGRDYTPRRYDPERRELDLDFVLHGDGPAASWALNAQPGDELWFAGPKSSTVVPADVDWVLLAGDETALPAIARFLESRPVAAPVHAVILISDSSARQELALRDDDHVQWVLAAPGDAEAISDAVGALVIPKGNPYVWAAAESKSLLAVRRFVRAQGVPKSHTNITGYWNSQQEAAPTDSAEGRSVALPEAPTRWFAIRAALRIGLLDAVANVTARGESVAVTSADLAADLSIEFARLEVLIDVLIAGDILTKNPQGGIGLGYLGEELIEDEHEQEHFAGFEADQVLALAALPEALVAAPSAWERTHARSLRHSATADTKLYAEFVEDSERASYVLTGLSRQVVWDGRRDIAMTGPGAAVVSAALVGGNATLTIVEDPGPLAVLRDKIDNHDGYKFSEAWGTPDLAVTAFALSQRTDNEIWDLLVSLRAAAQEAVLIEQLTPDGLGAEHLAEQALVDFASLGSPGRSPETVFALATAAGWTVRARRELGWGMESVELVATDLES